MNVMDEQCQCVYICCWHDGSRVAVLIRRHGRRDGKRKLR